MLTEPCLLFQDELSLSLKSLQNKLETLKRIHLTSTNLFKYIKVTCDEMICDYIWFWITKGISGLVK